METLLPELRLALRTLWRTPGFTAAAAISIALGIGANTVIFSVVNAVLLRPLPYPEPDRLYSARANQSPLDMRDLREAARAQVAQAGVFAGWPADLVRNGEAVHVHGAVVSGGLFAALQVAPALGRLLDDRDDLPRAAPVAVISHRLFAGRLGSLPEAIGGELVLNGTPYTVVGVMPEGFVLPGPGEDPGSAAEVFVPFSLGYAEAAGARNARFSTAVVRLATGTTAAQAQAALAAAAARIVALYAEDKDRRFDLVPLRDKVVMRARPALLLLFGAVGLLLLVSCVNFANLLLARGLTRQRELAIRTAMGASRAQIARHLLVESLLLALLGGACGFVLAAWCLPALLALQPANALPPHRAGLDAAVLGFTLALSLLTGIIFGLVPALRGARVDLHLVLQQSAAQIAGGGEWLRRALVVCELSLCLVLLAGMGLLLRSFLNLTSAPLGFEPDAAVSLEVALPAARYGETARVRGFFAALLREAREAPGAAEVGLVSELPLGGSSISHDLVPEGREETGRPEVEAAVRLVSPGTFRALGILLLRGRAFGEDDGPGAPPVVVISDAFARRFFPGQDPIGKRLHWSHGEPGRGPPPWMTVVGVAGDIRHRSPELTEGPALYYPFAQNEMAWRRWTHLIARPAGGVSAGALLADLRARLHQLDPLLAPGDAETLRDVVAGSLAQRRFQMLLIALFAAVALVLAAVGIYGVVSYSVSRRTREFGVRIALGAERRHLLRLVLEQSLALVGVALFLGSGAAAAAVQLLAASLYGVGRSDPMTYVCTAIVLATVTLAASWLPARRAARVDPMAALREE